MKALRCLALIGVVTVLAGCGGGPVEVQAPRPDARAVRACTSLSHRLPQTLDGQSRRATEPASPLVTAWGSPPIVLRCGVRAPERLRPTSRLAVVNGVEWFPEPHHTPLRFTAVHRVARVELVLPEEYGAPAGALVELARPLKNSVPPR